MNISLTFGADNVARLTFDRPNSSANVFDVTTLNELDAHLAVIEARGDLEGVVLISAKPKFFIAGADLNAFSGASSEQLADMVDLGHRVFTRLEQLKVPSVAAINGVCLGGGCELALACDWRVASLDKSTLLGLPETQLGILPAWGGSVRLPRLIGLPAALGLILTGKQLAGARALKAGLVDGLAHPEYLFTAACRLLVRGKRGPTSRKILSRAPFKAFVAWKARRNVLVKTRGHYPAPLKAIEVCTSALGQPLAEALACEKSGFLELVGTPACRNLMNLYFLQERAKKLLPPGPAEAAPVRRVAVIGAGVMGAGIAQWISARGIPVLLKDVDAAALARGLRSIGKIYEDATRRHVFTATEARAGFDRITPVSTSVPLAGVDLVIEAAVEKLDLKQRIFQQLEARVRPDAILATNTSALSIDAISADRADPGRVVGFHFFNPVHRMQLVEIVRGARTSDATVATAVQFARTLGKLPVLVNDSPGFVVNRILMPYLVEAVRLFEMGCAIRDLDELMLDFGMPMGPLRLCDEVGLDVALHVAKDLERRLPHPIPLNDTLERMIAKGWLGKKSGCGFYVHGAKGGPEVPNPAARSVQIIPAEFSIDAATQLDRLVLLMVNEAARCLEEKVVRAPEDVDFSMIFGTGWAPFRGGPLRYADSLGVLETVKRLEKFALEVAPYFAPCERLRNMVSQRTAFYPGS